MGKLKAKWFLAIAVIGWLSTVSVPSTDSAVESFVTLSPAKGSSDKGVGGSPSELPPRSEGRLLETEGGKEVPLGYEVDLETLKSLKANLPLSRDLEAVYIEDPNVPTPLSSNAPSLATGFQGGVTTRSW